MTPVDKIASAERTARRANKIAVVALVLSTLMSGASLVFNVYRFWREDNRTEKQEASAVVIEKIGSTNANNDPVYKFSNYSKVPVDEVHALFYDTNGKRTRNYKLGLLPRCHQLGLLVESRLQFTSIEFTDPDGHRWVRRKGEPVELITSVNTAGEETPKPYDQSKLEPGSYDLKALPYCA